MPETRRLELLAFTSMRRFAAATGMDRAISGPCQTKKLPPTRFPLSPRSWNPAKLNIHNTFGHSR
jgi:hypothetical protein